jgi:hypothetical protein
MFHHNFSDAHGHNDWIGDDAMLTMFDQYWHRMQTGISLPLAWTHQVASPPSWPPFKLRDYDTAGNESQKAFAKEAARQANLETKKYLRALRDRQGGQLLVNNRRDAYFTAAIFAGATYYDLAESEIAKPDPHKARVGRPPDDRGDTLDPESIYRAVEAFCNKTGLQLPPLSGKRPTPTRKLQPSPAKRKSGDWARGLC